MAESGPHPEPRASYFEELHVALVVALVVICVVLGIVAWNLHPRSTGFPPLPQDLQVLVPGSGFGAGEYLIQSGEDGATLKVSTTSGKGFVPLHDSDVITLLGGPQGGGPAGISIGPDISLDGKKLTTSQWAYVVLNPGPAVPCDPHLHYKFGTVTDPVVLTPTPAIVVPPLKPQEFDGDTVMPPGLCLHWATSSPVSLSGPYLSARFPPLRGISSRIPYTGIQQTGDLGTGKVTRRLTLEDGVTASFAIQTDPQPTFSATTSWTWTSKDSPQLLQVAAIDSSATQHENNDAFYSGVLFGVVGGALISLITELVVPLRHRHLRGTRPPPPPSPPS